MKIRLVILWFVSPLIRHELERIRDEKFLSVEPDNHIDIDCGFELLNQIGGRSRHDIEAGGAMIN
jgi:hypothetical protein